MTAWKSLGSLLAWEPTHPGLLDDLAHGEFFQGAQR
jgi:hypothetical protein